MNIKYQFSKWAIFFLFAVLIVAGCSNNTSEPAQSTEPAAAPESVVVATVEPVSTQENVIEPLPTAEPVVESQPVIDEHLLYKDDFNDPSSGWSSQEFDNYFYGYHEPEYYHVEVHEPNDSVLTSMPEKPVFTDLTIEAKVFTDPNNSATSGDFRYGLVFRRAGNLYYSFTISPSTQKWYFLKHSANALEVLKEGEEDIIQGLTAEDKLRVDVEDSTFFLHINDQFIDQVEDPDYSEGEVGLFVQTFDSPRVHVHFDELTLREVETPEPQAGVLFNDDFNDPSSGWSSQEFDNYFIGYHEPEYYHVEVHEPNDSVLTSIPDKPVFTDLTIEAKLFIDPNNSATSGDFRYGLVFRRSGNLYYSFTISPSTQKWYFLKHSANALEVLKEGEEDTIQGLTAEDTLRVDVEDSTFFLHINEQFIGHVNDPDYSEGEVGLFVQTFDSPRVHVHFDELTIREVETPQLTCSVISLALSVRSGPSTSFDPPIAFLENGTNFDVLGRISDGNWINIQLEDSQQKGWVANSEAFFSCNFSTDDLPVIEP